MPSKKPKKTCVACDRPVDIDGWKCSKCKEALDKTFAANTANGLFEFGPKSRKWKQLHESRIQAEIARIERETNGTFGKGN
jgi:hypothetical protein